MVWTCTPSTILTASRRSTHYASTILTRRLPSSSGSTRYPPASTPATTPSPRCGRRPRTRALAGSDPALRTPAQLLPTTAPHLVLLLSPWQENMRARGFGPQPPQLAAQAPRLAVPQHPVAPGGAPGAPAVPAPAGAMGGGMGRAARPFDGARMGMLLALASPIALPLTPAPTPYTPAPPRPPLLFLPLFYPYPPTPTPNSSDGDAARRQRRRRRLR
jgi:hypothetical protein